MWLVGAAEAARRILASHRHPARRCRRRRLRRRLASRHRHSHPAAPQEAAAEPRANQSQLKFNQDENFVKVFYFV